MTARLMRHNQAKWGPTTKYQTVLYQRRGDITTTWRIVISKKIFSLFENFLCGTCSLGLTIALNEINEIWQNKYIRSSIENVKC